MKESRTIACYETDAQQQLKPVAFMNIAQELANSHATSLGFGYNQFIEKELFWVLSRLHVVFLRAPRWQEHVTVETWHKGESGLFALRDFEVFAQGEADAHGEAVAPLVLATSSWLIMHAPTRRLQRTDHIPGLKGFGVLPRHAIETPCGKLEAPSADTLTLWGTHRVLPSDLDFNGHTNNAKYMEWATDCLAQPATSASPSAQTSASSSLREFQINFNAETRLGDPVDLYTAQTGPSTYYVEGRKEGHNVFQMTATLSVATL